MFLVCRGGRSVGSRIDCVRLIRRKGGGDGFLELRSSINRKTAEEPGIAPPQVSAKRTCSVMLDALVEGSKAQLRRSGCPTLELSDPALKLLGGQHDVPDRIRRIERARLSEPIEVMRTSPASRMS